MIKIEDLFFRDHYDFGTKIGVFYLFGPTNIFDEPKWPSDQKRLDAPGLGDFSCSLYLVKLRNEKIRKRKINLNQTVIFLNCMVRRKF